MLASRIQDQQFAKPAQICHDVRKTRDGCRWLAAEEKHLTASLPMRTLAWYRKYMFEGGTMACMAMVIASNEGLEADWR